MAFDATVGGASSNSYAAVADADTYFTDRANAAWAALTLDQRQAALIQATDYLEATYAGSWYGERASDTQRLAWPRLEVYVDGVLQDEAAIPEGVRLATFELAVRASVAPLVADQTQTVKREKVDVLEVEYMNGSTPGARYAFVDRLIASFVRGVVGSGNFQQARMLRV